MFTTDMASILLSEDEWNDWQPDDLATLRVYVTVDSKRAVVVKEDDLLSKKDLPTMPSKSPLLLAKN